MTFLSKWILLPLQSYYHCDYYDYHTTITIMIMIMIMITTTTTITIMPTDNTTYSEGMEKKVERKCV